MNQTVYSDPTMETDRQRGYADGAANHPCRFLHNMEFVTAYLTGYSEGADDRQAEIREKRIAVLAKAREARK